MTALVLLALVWTFLALSTAFVVGHGIRIADACRPARSRRTGTRATVHERRPVGVS